MKITKKLNKCERTLTKYEKNLVESNHFLTLEHEEYVKKLIAVNSDLIRHIRTKGKFSVDIPQIIKDRGDLRGSLLGITKIHHRFSESNRTP